MFTPALNAMWQLATLPIAWAWWDNGHMLTALVCSWRTSVPITGAFRLVNDGKRMSSSEDSNRIFHSIHFHSMTVSSFSPWFDGHLKWIQMAYSPMSTLSASFRDTPSSRDFVAASFQQNSLCQGRDCTTAAEWEWDQDHQRAAGGDFPGLQRRFQCG